MKKYQIVEITENFNHAGTKATADIAVIADRLGYSRLNICMNTTKDTKLAKIQRQIGYRKDWDHCLHSVEEGAVVLLQHPFHHPQLTREKTLQEMKEKKHVKYICLIHDVEKLRAFRYNEYYRREFEFMMRIADVFIVHNPVMKTYFEELGVPSERLVSLEIFDYLQKDDNLRPPKFERSITVAGNLDTAKCGYIRQLGMLKDVKVNLYGMNYDTELDACENIHYYGSFAADEIPHQLNSGFGLVWDGDSISGCTGEAGQYVRYNNPHKLSLYLSSGLPVVIWENAAEAEFVKRYGVGICVGSLDELAEIFKEMGQEEYKSYLNAVGQIAGRLRSGDFAAKALVAAENIVEE